MNDKTQTTTITPDDDNKKLRDHVAWLEAELKRYQDNGCVAVAERIHNQQKKIHALTDAVREASDKLIEVLNAKN